MEETNLKGLEMEGLFVGEPVNVEKMFNKKKKPLTRVSKSSIPVEEVIAWYGLSGLEGQRDLLLVYQNFLVAYERTTVPQEHLRAWEILVAGHVKSDRNVAATVLRWGMQRCSPVKRAQHRLLRQVLES